MALAPVNKSEFGLVFERAKTRYEGREDLTDFELERWQRIRKLMLLCEISHGDLVQLTSDEAGDLAEFIRPNRPRD